MRNIVNRLFSLLFHPSSDSRLLYAIKCTVEEQVLGPYNNNRENKRYWSFSERKRGERKRGRQKDTFWLVPFSCAVLVYIQHDLIKCVRVCFCFVRLPLTNASLLLILGLDTTNRSARGLAALRVCARMTVSLADTHPTCLSVCMYVCLSVYFCLFLFFFSFCFSSISPLSHFIF